MFTSRVRVKVEFQIFSERRRVGKSDRERESEREEDRCIERKREGFKYSVGDVLCEQGLSSNIRQFNNKDFSSEVSTVHKFVYTDEAFILVRQ